MENVNIAENVESDSLNEVLGFGGDDGGGSTVSLKPPSQGGASSRVGNSSSRMGMDALKAFDAFDDEEMDTFPSKS
ncbi:hypothetical protein GIB67_011866 [Kingdonia uniflora]|uniref:Uncharacterized protein n=1 Tax=Kingdonia uniflora TaxID=39325 RepID=A0A7J7KVQ5_9MAGN|nr:hypothetical protein GIB67_011866 [Kingdonia uniflora]